MLEKIKKLSNKNKYKLILIIILVVFCLLVSIGIGRQIVKIINEQKAIKTKEIMWQIYKIEGTKAEVLVTFENKEGIEKISYQNYESEEKVIDGHRKRKIAIDYKMEDRNSYKFKVEYPDGTEKEFTIDFEFPRIKGEYILKNGVYFNKPDVSTGLSEKTTRYMYLNDNGNLLPGDWINKEAPDNWYDYANRQWANLYVENEGADSYYVWIPRYCYKVDEANSVAGNERMDVKFIDVNNNYKYIDSNTNEEVTIEWDELEIQGYKIPEAFSWSSQYGEHSLNSCLETIIPGYWISKYQLAELESYIIDYTAKVNLTSVEVENIKLNTTQTVAEYIYAIDGEIIKQPSTSTGYTFQNVTEGDKTINVTALDANGEIIGSMTKTLEVAEPNEPELSEFDKDTTFYVYWDKDGNEHNEVPISKEAPSEWYNYTIGNWANIVTRNDGLETYYVWIPRYSYKLNSISERSYVKFLKGTESEDDPNYQIPEAFWWDNNGNSKQDEGEQLTGYWITKYQLTSEETDARINAEMSAGSNLIRVKDITGTALKTQDGTNVPIKYEYYLNGDKQDFEGSSSTDNYIFENLEENTTYTINIIARNSETDEYIGAVTKKITTVSPYTPDISSFNKDTTFYVYWDDHGNETRVSIKENPPANWYDYSNQQWANIVTTANGTETYFVWIPRYEYKILSDRENLNKANRRIDVNFITTDIENSNCSPGYKVPEAFWWDNNSNGQVDEGEKLKGYWISKYQLRD